jgi:hypothetical protein
MSRMVIELLDLARSRPETGMPVDRRPVDLANEGEPIPPEIMDSIFEPFSRGAGQRVSGVTAPSSTRA